MSSSDAPPPVLTWSTRSARPNCRIAAALSPPPITVKPWQSATASATAQRARRERLELEDAHRAVPEHVRGAADRVGEDRRGLGPDVETLPAVGDAAPRRRSGSSASAAMSCAITTSTGTLTRPVSSSALQSVDPVGLEQRVADRVALRGEERERHRAADEDRLALVEQRADDAELVADLGAAEHADERLLRVVRAAPRAPRPRGTAAGRPALGRIGGGPTIDACARCDAPNASFT